MSKPFNIDELFRRGARKHHFEPTDADREAAMQTLDQQMPQGRFKRWSLLLLALLAVASGMTAYAFFAGLGSSPELSASLTSHDQWKAPVSTEQVSFANTDAESGSRAAKDNEPRVGQPTAQSTGPTKQADQSGVHRPMAAGGEKQSNNARTSTTAASSLMISTTGKEEETTTEVKASSTPVADQSKQSGETNKEEKTTPAPEIDYRGYFKFLVPRKSGELQAFANFGTNEEKAIDPLFERTEQWLGLSVRGSFLGSPAFTSQELSLLADWSFHPNWTLTSGMGYWWRPINDIEYTASGKDYGFGREDISVTWEPRHTHYLKMPLTVSYHLNIRNKVTAGVEANMLINSYSRITTTTDPGSGESMEETMADWGYNEGLQSVFHNWLIGYEYRLHESWSIGTALRFGYGRMFEPTYFENHQISKTNGAIQIRYHIR